MTMWYLIRSCGLVAYLAFSLSVGLGAASVVGGRSPARIDARLVRQLLHRSTAVIGLLALSAHLVLLVLDSYLPTPVSAVLVPMSAPYQAFALGVGTLAMYALVLAALSGWLRLATAAILPERGWRWLHSSAYLGWALGLGHGLLSGPDTGQSWGTLTYLVGAVIVAVGLLARLLGPHRRRVRRSTDGLLTNRFQEIR